MISVVIPTWNSESTLGVTLTALVPAVVDGIVREVIVVDSGSTDQTRKIVDAAGATLLEAKRGRGDQLSAGAAVAKHGWLLFLHADTVLEPNWHLEVAVLMEEIACGTRKPTASCFRFVLNDTGFFPRLLERGVAFRCLVFALPFGDQGLLISRQLYDEIGGFKPLPLFEDVDIVHRLGRRRVRMLRSTAATSAVRYQRAGYVTQVLRNWYCILLYYLGVSPKRIAEIYNG